MRRNPSQIDPCPLLVGWEKLGGKWTLAVLREILDRPLRFTELQKRVPGISGKSLARVLGRLERDAMIQRKVDSSRPPRVTYQMHRHDRLVRDVIEALTLWGKEHSTPP